VSTGVTDVISRLTEQDKACPNQKFALVGYSQGAGVMRGAAPKIPQAIQDKKIAAVVMYGDPGLKRNAKFPPALQSRLFENCAPGDPVSSSLSSSIEFLTKLSGLYGDGGGWIRCSLKIQFTGH
jgi:cutinase